MIDTQVAQKKLGEHFSDLQPSYLKVYEECQGVTYFEIVSAHFKDVSWQDRVRLITKRIASIFGYPTTYMVQAWTPEEFSELEGPF